MASPSPSSIKLYYFNGRGKAETIRFILAYAQVPYEDIRLARDNTWVSENKAKFPLGQLPVLEFTDSDGNVRTMIQSTTIIHQCARWFGLAGETEREKAEADEVLECLRDIAQPGVLLFAEKNPERKEALTSTLRETVAPRVFGYLERKLIANGGVYIAGGKSFTCADIAIAASLDSWCHEAVVVPHIAYRGAIIDFTLLEPVCPGILELRKRVCELPAIKSYLSSRCYTPY